MIPRNADGSRLLAQLERLVVAEVRSVWESLQGARSGEAAEKAVLEWSRKVGRVVLEAGVQARVEMVEREERRACPCGGSQQVHSYRPRTVLTLLGAVRIVRQYRRCRECGWRSFPGDGWLGWEGAFSRRLEEAVAWSAAALPYRAALEGLRRFCGIELSLSAAQDMAGRWGSPRVELAGYAEPVKGRLGVEIDGTMAHIDGDWREIKLGSFLRWQAGKAEAISYVADWLNSEEFQEPLWGEALVRGAPEARQVAVIADGAAWIWQTANTLFPRATEILDFYHACEHLWQAGRVVHGEATPETRALVKRWQGALRQGCSEGLEEELRELASQICDPQESLRKTADYLDHHQARLRYPLFRQAGWPIGSGVVEGGCKNVIGLRFKRKSARWKKPGFRAILHLRLDLLNNRWEKRCNLLRKAA